MRGAAIPVFRRLLGLMLSASLAITLVTLGGLPRTQAAAKVLYVGINMPFTGDETEEAELEKNGAILAIEEANAKGGVAGYKIDPIILNDATAAAGGYDPVQSAVNARKLVANPGVVAVIGPMDSGAGKAMSPILSEGDLATITPSTTSPDITDPKFAGQFRPAGKAIYFRTCGTEVSVGRGWASYYAKVLKVKSVYILDDGGAGGAAGADRFEKFAKEKGIKVLGRDQLNAKESDYSTGLTKIKGLNPDLLFYSGIEQAGVKLAKQAYEIIPKVIKGDTGGLYGGDFLRGVGFPAVEGWYVSSAAPHVLDTPAGQLWVKRFAKRFGQKLLPADYTLTSYGAALVIIDSIERVAKSGNPVNRHTVRDAIQDTHLKTLQGNIQFDANGDLRTGGVSLFQVTHNSKYSDNDLRQFKYIGVAPSD
jgi:branched-chain amino acid transport system substrate-binding protein